VDSAQGDGAFEGTLKVTNTGSWPIDAWALRWQLSEGYQITKMDYGELTQEGIRVTVNDKAGIGNRSTVTIHLAGTGDAESARPANLTLNTTPCGFG
jgi:VCBS repeat-containing protein